ncbi:hypothetical protein AcV7_001846 [Taiwanofungus camphoratus]|nr:hypothetical protein AcV7_001846 [Antrodia cinnamomea]
MNSQQTRSSYRQFAANNQGSDDGELRQAVLAVVQVWLNRLQLVSGITSFFASIDALLFSLASSAERIGDPDLGDWSAVDQLTTASLCGALIFHVCSAILAFVASFILVRLQLVDTDQQEVEVGISTLGRKYIGRRVFGKQRTSLRHPINCNSPPFSTVLMPSVPIPDEPPEPGAEPGTDLPPSAAYSAVFGRVTIHCIRPFSFLKLSQRPDALKPAPSAEDSILDVPVALLSRCHTLAVWMAVLGFILAVIGILAYAWAATPKSISIFSTACLGGCLLAGVFAVW